MSGGDIRKLGYVWMEGLENELSGEFNFPF